MWRRGNQKAVLRLSCILATECARTPLRVPAVYLAHAILAVLAVAAIRGMNNLRVCVGRDGSIPTAPTNIFFSNSKLQICEGA